MDSDLPGSETPGAILDYVKESKEISEKETKKDENKEIDLKEIKKKIFDTFMNVEKIYKEDEYGEYFGNKLIEWLKYDNKITQDIYETIRLSDPSRSKQFYAKLSTERKIDYIGPIGDIKIKKNYEPNQFVIILKNGVEVTYNKGHIKNKADKKKKIEDIMNYFDKIKNDKWFYINIELKEYYLGQIKIIEPIIIDYKEFDIWKVYKNTILDKKEKYRLTYYEYILCGMFGLNPFDLVGHEKELFDWLYIPRILGLFNVKTPILPKDMVPYTHILQFTPPATGKTIFALSAKNYFNMDYFDKLPSRTKLVYDAQKDKPGSIYYHEYITIDEITKSNIEDIKEFLKNTSTGLSSGIWPVEKGSYVATEPYKPVGFIIFGNVLGEKEIEDIQKIDPYFEGIDYKKFENSREVAANILYKGLKDSNYREDINTFIDRISITSIILEKLNISKLGILNLMPNPLESFALKYMIQERINEIAKDPKKYIDIEKIDKEIDKEKEESARLRSHAIKIAIKLRALEIDDYLGKSTEDLAIEMVKGIWGWNPK